MKKKMKSGLTNDELAFFYGHYDDDKLSEMHPRVIIGGVLQENPFFVSPDQLQRSARKSASIAG